MILTKEQVEYQRAYLALMGHIMDDLAGVPKPRLREVLDGRD